MIEKCKLQAGNPMISGLFAFTIKNHVAHNYGNKTGTGQETIYLAIIAFLFIFYPTQLP